MDLSPAALQSHARDLAKAFNVRLIESDQLRPEEAMAMSGLRIVLSSGVIDETTYAVALHEIGHLASPTGLVRNVTTGDRGNLLRVEEDAAWTWARHYALCWTPAMEAVARWAEQTYAAPSAPAPVPLPADRIIWNDQPQAPVAPTKSIDWKAWK